MNPIIIVTPEHPSSVPLLCNLGEHQVIITRSYGDMEAFEPGAPQITEEETSTQEPTILDHHEAYNLYQCLHELFHSRDRQEG